MLWSRRANGIALTWGHTRLSETDFRLITQESPGFIHGECQIRGLTIHHLSTTGKYIGDLEQTLYANGLAFEFLNPCGFTTKNTGLKLFFFMRAACEGDNNS